MNAVLSRIVAQKQAEIAEMRAHPAPPSQRVRKVCSLRDALMRKPSQPLRLLAEHKRKSPSAGALSQRLDPAERALAYAEAGAHAISVLLDRQFFDGDYSHLASIHHALALRGFALPLLAKEFILDPVQIAWAYAHGADAALLIVRLLDDTSLRALLDACNAHEIAALVEVVNEDEAARALRCGAQIIGVNARDLDTLQMDLPRARRTLQALPSGVIGVHLSGVHTPAQIAEIAQGPAHAALLGEALMRQDDPRSLLAQLLAASSGAQLT